MKSKKLIRNVLVMLVALMTTAMVLSSCSNASDSEYANITIRLSGSGSGRAISSEEKSAATFNVYFNDSQVASNISGTYNGTAQVGTRLNVRVDALVNGKRIARGENTITVMAGTNNVAIKLNENREVISYRELSTARVGDVICANGKVLSASDITAELQSQTVAIVYKIDSSVKKVWAVGKNLSISGAGMKWADQGAEGYNKNIAALQEENDYTDGSRGLEILLNNVTDANGADLATNYSAWDYACNYGTNQGLDSFQTGWYLPSKQELKEVYDNKTAIEQALEKTGVAQNTFGRTYYWSSTQTASANDKGYKVYFVDGRLYSDFKYAVGIVCAVRQFTY